MKRPNTVEFAGMFFKVTPLQRDILTVLRINPTPLMTAVDIASVLNEWGACKAATGIGAACSGLMGKCMVSRKAIWSGRWLGLRPNYDYSIGSRPFVHGVWNSKSNYWYLIDRQHEVHPNALIEGLRKSKYGTPHTVIFSTPLSRDDWVKRRFLDGTT